MDVVVYLMIFRKQLARVLRDFFGVSKKKKKKKKWLLKGQ
jgi:hypothetical protein